MIRGSRSAFAALILLAGCSVAWAQDATIGAGKLEIGGFPGGGTFFVGGDDNKEVNFNVYTAGGGVTYYFTSALAVEGEFTGSVGWAQDVQFNNATLVHNQMPTVWSYSGNIVFFPGGTTGKQTPFYVTAGIGQLALSPRVPTTAAAGRRTSRNETLPNRRVMSMLRPRPTDTPGASTATSTLVTPSPSRAVTSSCDATPTAST